MLGELGIREVLVVVLIAMVLFGTRRIPDLLGAFGRSIGAFKRNLQGPDGGR